MVKRKSYLGCSYFIWVFVICNLICELGCCCSLFFFYRLNKMIINFRA